MRFIKAHILGAIKASWTTAFVLFGIIFVVQYVYTDLDHIGPSLHLSPTPLAVTLVLHSGFWLFSSLYWKYLIRVMTKGNISVKQSFSQFVLLSIGKYLPGKVWGMIARGAQLKRSGINAMEVVTATFYEQLIVLHSAAILSSMLFAVLRPTWWAWLLALAAVGSPALVAVLPKFGIKIYTSIARKIGSDQGAHLPRPITVSRYVVLVHVYSIAWIINGLVLAGIYATFFQEAVFSTDIVLALILANTVSIAAGFLAIFAPGGIGVREAVNSSILSYVMPLKDAVLLNIFFRLWLTATDVLLGSVIILMAIRTRGYANQNPVSSETRRT